MLPALAVSKIAARCCSLHCAQLSVADRAYGGAFLASAVASGPMPFHSVPIGRTFSLGKTFLHCAHSTTTTRGQGPSWKFRGQRDVQRHRHGFAANGYTQRRLSIAIVLQYSCIDFTHCWSTLYQHRIDDTAGIESCCASRDRELAPIQLLSIQLLI